MNRYIGDIESINPLYEEVEMIYITIEQWQDTTFSIHGKSFHHQPSFWFIYKDWMYLGVCNYEMEFLMTYDDIEFDNKEPFNQFSPGINEFNWLVKLGVTYYKVNYEKMMVEDNLGHFSIYETDFIKIWNRDRKINKLIGN